MQKYAGYLGSKADNNIVAYGLGDWYDIGPNPPGYAQLTSNGLTATAIYYTDVTVPANSNAVIWLPTADADKITEHGVSLEAVDGIKAVETVGGRTKVKTGSGTYLFAVETEK